MPTAIILSQGDEVVTGQITDTNAAWLATALTDLGLTVKEHITVRDDLADIEAQVSQATHKADVIVSTGGLGPTEDDLTAQAISRVFNRPLLLDEDALNSIIQRYETYGRPMPVVNKKQALLPKDAKRIDNHWGTAPGFALTENQCLMVFMPGVPNEMKNMFDQIVRPLLSEQLQLQPWRLITFRTTGVGESTLQERIGTFSHDRILLSYRTKLPENHIKLRIPPDVADEEVNTICDELVQKIGSPLFAVEGLEGHLSGDLATVVGQLLKRANASVAVAESCTGGRIASMFTAIPGSSAWFREGCITYSNASKVRQLGVQDDTLTNHGAVSVEVCREMAQGIRAASGATYGLASTGIAGPGGGTAEKPLGTVHIGLQTPTEFYTRRLRIPGHRERVQHWSAGAAVDMLRRHLQNFHLKS